MKKIRVTMLVAVLLAIPATAGAGGPGGILQSKNPNVNYTEGTDFTVPSSPVPAGNTVAAVSAADDGCDAADFTGFPVGDIALVERGTCLFGLKAANAQAAGASGVLIYNNVDGISGTSLADFDIDIPVLFITQDLGQSFVNRVNDEGMRAHMLVRKPAE